MYGNTSASIGFCGLGQGETDDGGAGFYQQSNLTIATDGDSSAALLANLYSIYGRNMPLYVQGSFAFVIHDTEANQVFAARDLFGAKPLYYHITEHGNLVFASEMKALLSYPGFVPTINERALEQYLTFQYSVLPETFFAGVYKLPPGHFLAFQDGRLEICSYDTLEFNPVNYEHFQAVADIESAVQRAASTAKAEPASVNTGAFLSSGVDSSFIAACFAPSKSFTVGFANGDYSEVEYAKGLSEHLGLPHYAKIISAEEYFDCLPNAIYHMDEPLADPAAIAFYFACQLAGQHVKAAYSGEGPDEFFGGYAIYREPLDLGRIAFVPMPIRRVVSKLLSLLPFSVKGMGYLIRAGQTVEERFVGNAKIFSQSERQSILKRHSSAPIADITLPLYTKAAHMDDVTKMQYIDIHLWMPGNILHQADRMSMAFSLAVKTPYLTRDIVDIALRLPTKLRVSRTDAKIAFRAVALKHLPEAVARKKKLGFPVPIRVWLREDKFYNIVKDHFVSDTAERFFHIDKLLRLLEHHKAGRVDNSRKIWTVFIFLIWHKRFFDDDF